MLYLTTREDWDAFTCYRAQRQDRGPEGGFFLPMRPPHFDEHDLTEIAGRSFNQNVAHILNKLYRGRLTGWDVEFAAGRYPVRLVQLGSRTAVAETWHNVSWKFDGFVRNLEKMLNPEPGERPAEWFTLSVRIAVLFGVFGELMAAGVAGIDSPVDVVVPSFDFQAPMAAWYAREWGLPIGTIICCCNENSGIWSLLHQGELRTDAPLRHTATPACDQVVPAGVERLIWEVLGLREARRFVECCTTGTEYQLDPISQEKLRRGISVAVVSERRMEFMVPNIFKTSGRIPDPYTAMAYGGLLDHRSRVGENNAALIISDESPIFSVNLLSGAMGISPKAIRDRLNRG